MPIKKQSGNQPHFTKENDPIIAAVSKTKEIRHPKAKPTVGGTPITFKGRKK